MSGIRKSDRKNPQKESPPRVEPTYEDVKRKFGIENMTIEEYKSFCELFDKDLYDDISLAKCVEKRISYGGTSVASVEAQIASVRSALNTPDILK